MAIPRLGIPGSPDIARQALIGVQGKARRSEATRRVRCYSGLAAPSGVWEVKIMKGLSPAVFPRVLTGTTS